MFNEILFVITIFVTRIVLPIGVTLCLGSLLERTLRRGAQRLS